MSAVDSRSAATNGQAHTDAAPAYLLERGFPAEIIREVQWRVEVLGDRFRRYGLPPEASSCLVWLIPYRHPNGHPWFERIRLIDPADLERLGGGKYRQPGTKPKTKVALYDPFGVLAADEPLDELLLIEGEANAVAARVLVPDVPVIGLPGQSALRTDLAEQLAHIPVVYVWIDRHDPSAEENLRRIVERLKEAGVDEVRALPPTPGHMDANDMLREDPKHAGQWILDMLEGSEVLEARAEEWSVVPQPTPPAFPVAALGEDLAAFVTAVATQTQTAPDLSALTVLGVLNTVSLTAKVSCGNFDEETLALYILAVSPSGDRKSTVLKKVAAPLYRLEHEARQRSKAQRLQQESRLCMLQEQKKVLLARVKKLDDETEWATAQEELARIAGELEEAAEFAEARLLTDDATPEGIAELLARHETGVAVLSAESAVIDNLLGHYSDKGKANLHVVCKAYNAEPTSVDRRGAPALIIPRPLLGITLLSQPHVLEKVLGHGTARGQGLIGRFILVDASNASFVGRRQIDPPPPPVPQRLYEAWEAIVQKVKTACDATKPTQGGFVGFVAPGESQSLTLTLSPSSKKLLTELQVSVEPRQADGADLATYRDWISRHHGRVARIAGLLHLVERAANEPIAAETMQRALAIGDYILKHGLLVLSAPNELHRRTRDWLARQEDTVISLRQIRRGALGAHKTEESAESIAGALVEAGILRELVEVEADAPNPKGGRPKGPRFEINPRIRSGR